MQYFVSWVNHHLQQRNLQVQDLQADFTDGVLFIELLEILTGKKVPRYTKKPRFLSQKLDNISVALEFLEKNLNVKVVGCNPQSIADGNTSQLLGIIFLLIQRLKSIEKGTRMLSKSFSSTFSSSKKKGTSHNNSHSFSFFSLLCQRWFERPRIGASTNKWHLFESRHESAERS
jgi:hypothetical protein